MPNCFQLYRLDNPTKTPVKFSQVDRELCAHLGVPCHDRHWHAGWYDVFGFGLAVGHSWEQMAIREQMNLDEILDQPVPIDVQGNEDEGYWLRMYVHNLRILDFLRKNFGYMAWYER